MDQERAPEKKLFLKFYSVEDIAGLSLESAGKWIVDAIVDQGIKHVFIVSSQVEHTLSYSAFLENTDKAKLNVKIVVLKSARDILLPELGEAVRELAACLRRDNCQIVSYGDVPSGVFIACLLCANGKNPDDAIAKVGRINAAFAGDAEEIELVREFARKLDGYDGVFQDLELEIDERIDYQRIDQNDYVLAGARHEGLLERYSIRTKIIALIAAIVVVSLSVMILVATVFFRRDSEIRIRESNHNMAAMIAERVLAELRGSAGKAEIAAAIALGSRSAAGDLSELLFRGNGDFIFLGIAEKEGTRLKCKRSLYNRRFMIMNQLSEGDIGRINTTTALRFLDSFSGREVFYNISPEAGLPVLGISFPYEKSGEKIKSILLVHLNLTPLLRTFETTGIAEVFMVNDEGDLVAHQDRKRVLRRESLLADPLVRKMLASPVDNGQARYVDNKGVRRLGSFKEIPSLGLGVIVTAPEAAFFREVYSIRTRNLIILGIVLLSSILIAFFFSRTLTIPIVQLARATQQFQLRNMRVRAAKGSDEISYLRRSFKAMVFSIMDSQRKLQDYADNLEGSIRERTRKLQEATEALWGEMQLATKIQTVLLPHKPLLTGYTVHGYMHPAEEVGGDYYDIIATPTGGWVLIGDVSGHGVSAGLVMMMVQTSVRVIIAQNPGIVPNKLLAVVNGVIARNIKSLGEKKYMTITALKFDDAGHCSYAGLHLDLIIYRVKTGSVEFVKTEGMWIGMRDNIAGLLKDRKLKFAAGDILLLYTDGITEAMGADGRMFSTEKLAAILKANADLPVGRITEAVLDELRSGYRQSDDVTIVVMRKSE